MVNLKIDVKRMKKLPFLMFLLVWQAIACITYASGGTGLSIQQQNHVVRGKIIDTSGESLIGVSIVVKGTQNGTITDTDGLFNINAESNSTLVVTYLGFHTQEVPVNGQTTINITMREDVSELDEVVVVGYGVQKRATMTGAISAITANDLSRSVATTTSGALVGKIAGLNTRMPDGRPGSATQINIRNMGTPLFVIDGIQSDEAQFNNIDFNDIESLSVMKDASAAIYGVKAANGVIVVTTKRGRKETKNIVNVNGYYGWQNMFKFPEPASAETYVRSYIQSDAITKNPTPKFSMSDLEKWTQGTEKGYRPFDWYDYILNTAPQYYIGANTSGGSDKINYYFAVSNLDQQSIIVNYGGFNRTNVQMTLDAQITKQFKLSGSFSGRVDTEKHPGVPGGDDTWQALFAIYRNLPTARPFANDNPNYPARTAGDAGINFGMMNYDLSGLSKRDRRVMQFNINAEYKLLEGLLLKGQVGYNLNNEWFDNQEYTYKLYDYDEETDTYPVNFSMDNPWREREIKMIEELMAQVQVSYDKAWGEHMFNGVLAAESYKKDTPHFWVHARPASNALSLLDTKSVDEFNDYGVATQARIGYIGRLNYNFSQKYMLELSGRYDGSWKFPPGDRWGFFPSVSGGWRISEEHFWKDKEIGKIINDLKIRASYGLLGDDDLGKNSDDKEYYIPFDYMSGYNYGKNKYGDNLAGSALDGTWVVGAQSRGLPVTNISWLKSKIFDAGIDISLFGGKLIGTFDYFRRTRTGLPAQRYDVLIPKETGFDLPYENLNSDIHTGVDGSLVWRSSIADFTYSVGGNVTYARKLDWHQYKPRFGNAWDDYRNNINERYAYLNWGYHAIGQFQSWEEIASYPIDNDRQGNKSLRPGDIKYEDANGDGIINDLDQRPIGYREGGLPYLNFGLNFSFGYKGFDLAFDLTGAAYASYMMDYESRNPFHDGGNNPKYYMENQWMLSDITNPDSELIPGKYPTLIVGNSSHSNYWKSDFWTQNVNYIKLRNLELGYNFPKKWLSTVGIQKFRIYTLMQNLFCIDNLDAEIDPELTTGSGVQYPTNKVINVGFNLTF